MEVIAHHLANETVISLQEILEILPHRYPFLFVDKVIAMDLEKNTIVAQKNVTSNEEFFQGHFPNAPIMPGVLLVEAFAQTSGILVHKKGYTHEIAVILKINNVKFRNAVKPGDVLYIYAEALHLSAKGAKFKGKTMIGDKIAMEAEFTCALIAKNKI